MHVVDTNVYIVDSLMREESSNSVHMVAWPQDVDMLAMSLMLLAASTLQAAATAPAFGTTLRALAIALSELPTNTGLHPPYLRCESRE